MICRLHAGVWVFVIALFCGGCGTLQNLNTSPPTSQDDISHPTRIYGGVRQDWTDLKSLQFDDVDYVNFFFLPLYLADFPLSLLGDTLTLPYIVVTEVRRSFSDCSPPKSPPHSQQP